MRLEWSATVAAEHPALPGHFPGQPIVPGVVLLDAVVQALQARGQAPVRRIASAKFLRPVAAGEALAFSCEGEGKTLRFAVRCGDASVATGTVES